MENKDIIEDFCPACATIPLTIFGAGVYSGNNLYNKKYRKYKNYIFIFSLSVTIISFMIGVYYLFIKKDCNQCIA